MNIIKDFVNITYDLDTTSGVISPGSKLGGKIIVEALQNIGFIEVNFSFRYEVRGKINTRKKTVETNTLSTNKSWSKGKTYEFDVDINVPKLSYSYSGTNLEIIWFITLEIIPNENFKSKIRMDYLKDAKINKLFRSFKGKMIANHPIKIFPNDLVYEVTQEIKTIKNYSGGPISLGIIILSIIALFYAFGIHGVFSYIFGMIAFFAIGYGIYVNSSIGLLGKVLLGVTPYDKNSFNLDISIEKNSKRIEYIYAFYSIIEEVEDRRGTDRYTLTNTIYTSGKQKFIKPISKNIEVSFEYPKAFFPSSFEFETEKICWQVHLAIEFNNNTHYEVKENIEIKQIGN